MIRYTVLCDVMLSMHCNQLPAPAAPIVTHRTQPTVGWSCLGAALAVHAVLACLLLRVHQVSPDVPPPQLFEVTLDMAPGEVAAPPLPMTEAAPIDPPTPASAPEPEAIRPDVTGPLPHPGSIPDDVPAPVAAIPRLATSVPDTAPAKREQHRPDPRSAPPHPPRPTVKATAVPTARHAVAEPGPSDPTVSARPPSPTASATPTQAAVAAQAPSTEAVGAWRGALAAWLQDHRTYPDEARRDGTEGRVIVRFTVDRSGMVTSVALVSSSGSTVLDEAAQALLRGAHLPSPSAPAQDQLTVTLPVRYSLAH